MESLYATAIPMSRSARLQELVLVLRQYKSDAGRCKSSVTAVDGLAIFDSEHAMRAESRPLKPAIFITIQSAEWLITNDHVHDARMDGGFVVSSGVSCNGTVPNTTSNLPYIGLMIELNRGYMREMFEELGARWRSTERQRVADLVLLDLSHQLLDCALRSVRLLNTPEAIPMLYPGIMREICYWLLKSPARAQILDSTMASVYDSRVFQAIQRLRGKFSNQIRVDELADAAGMSIATFYRQFKSVTSMSPIQYQKQLRLLEARRLMITSTFNVEDVASRVGYVSTSQFSREYTRMFGKPPRRDMSTCRSLEATTGQLA